MAIQREMAEWGGDGERWTIVARRGGPWTGIKVAGTGHGFAADPEDYGMDCEQATRLIFALHEAIDWVGSGVSVVTKEADHG